MVAFPVFLKDAIYSVPRGSPYRHVVGAICDLLQEPHPHYSKRLQGSPYSRIAVGEYRVIYRADAESVYIIVFGKRNDDEIYKSLNRKI